MTSDKFDALRDAVENFEIASESVTDAISELVEVTEDEDLLELMHTAEPDQNVYEILKTLVSACEELVKQD